MKNVSLGNKIFFLAFVLSIFISAIHTPERKDIQDLRSTIDSVTIAVSKKQPKARYDTAKKMNIVYTLQVSDFDTFPGKGSDSNKIVLIPKSIRLLNQITIPPVKKKKDESN